MSSFQNFDSFCILFPLEYISNAHKGDKGPQRTFKHVRCVCVETDADRQNSLTHSLSDNLYNIKIYTFVDVFRLVPIGTTHITFGFCSNIIVVIKYIRYSFPFFLLSINCQRHAKMLLYSYPALFCEVSQIMQSIFFVQSIL